MPKYRIMFTAAYEVEAESLTAATQVFNPTFAAVKTNMDLISIQTKLIEKENEDEDLRNL